MELHDQVVISTEILRLLTELPSKTIYLNSNFFRTELPRDLSCRTRTIKSCLYLYLVFFLWCLSVPLNDSLVSIRHLQESFNGRREELELYHVGLVQKRVEEETQQILED